MTQPMPEPSTMWWACHNDPEPVGEGNSVMHRGGRKAMEGPPTGGMGAPAGPVKAGAQESYGSD